ncbi:MAG TPA: element excision factor XisH family protein, partial [Aggregatilineales bacterium]|nr:element excision factor XisH family protein [Aggregatilineales bacterium]
GFERSPIEQLATAIGKLQIYRFVLDKLGQLIPLWLAVPDFAYEGILTEQIGLTMREQNKIDLLVFSVEREEIVAWIPYERP